MKNARIFQASRKTENCFLDYSKDEDNIVDYIKKLHPLNSQQNRIPSMRKARKIRASCKISTCQTSSERRTSASRHSAGFRAALPHVLKEPLSGVPDFRRSRFQPGLPHRRSLFSGGTAFPRRPVPASIVFPFRAPSGELGHSAVLFGDLPIQKLLFFRFRQFEICPELLHSSLLFS